ncbi:helix-turn-helix domain-containing protein [Chryseobacterium sp. Tr-659]|uniref:helix-turn-helix domain-containing protein n=1 Tax=Chryseobacterium sp. Tr-659 TaxID=2608340 RepID=UPI00141F4DFE|nr:helix-turn-helix domain-containing protein [Chryseobacterium sp. Tr-659]NIF07437.1 helix-turn-helix domain-containing protein [Chryseobacterium sp. Tr-659]
MKPNYVKIYRDMIQLKFPEKEDCCRNILKNETISLREVIRLNSIISGDTKISTAINQKHKSYDKEMILYILDYQKKNNLNNIQIATQFKMSKNTIAKWRKLFA